MSTPPTGATRNPYRPQRTCWSAHWRPALPSTHSTPPPVHPQAGIDTVFFDDLHVFDPATLKWTLISADAPRPSARHSHGFTSAGGKLYVYGGSGYGYNGDSYPPRLKPLSLSWNWSRLP